MKIRCIVFLGALLFGSQLAKAQFPSSYDLRDFGYVSPVDDQGSCGACWAFATNAAIESAWLKQGFNAVDLSEDHMIDCHGFDEGPCIGGSYYMSQALLSRHSGALSEANDPYTPSLQNCTANLPFPPLAEAFVEEFRLLPAEIDSVKSALMNHGAVATTMYFNSANYNASSYKYFDAVIDASDWPYAHCVTIVGWDDALTFSGAPGNGGWIIKDSYGTNWADNGYFYCSYFDAGLLEESAIFPVRQEFPSGFSSPMAYYHDEYGWVDNHGFSSNTGYALAKYTLVPTGGTFAPQKILRVGSYAVEDNTQLTVTLFAEKNGHVLSGEMASATLDCPVKGFYTASFDLPAELPGTEVYIRVKYTCPSGTLNPIPIETVEANHTSNFVASQNASWVSSSGDTWALTGIGTNNNFDVCIKMYTETTDPTGLEANDVPAPTLFPNPAREVLHVRFEDSSTPKRVISIYSGVGQQLMRSTHNQAGTLDIDVAEWPSGIYWLEVEAGGEILHVRWVKQ